MTYKYLSNMGVYKEFLSQIDTKKGIQVTGISSEATGHFLFTIIKNKKRPVFVVFENEKTAKRFYDEQKDLLGSQLNFFPDLDLNIHGYANFDMTNKSYRMQSMKAILEEDDFVIYTYPGALLQKFRPLTIFKDSRLEIILGQDYDQDRIIQSLVDMGYSRTDTVAAKGEFSVKGSILDIFQTQEDHPNRIEFFDTEIDSIRTFDVTSQLSIEKLDKLTIYPYYEMTVFTVEKDQISQGIKADLEEVKKVFGDDVYEKARANYAEVLDNLENNMSAVKADLVTPYIDNKMVDFSDYIPEDALIITVDFAKIMDTHNENMAFIYEQFKYGLETGYMLPTQIKTFADEKHLIKSLWDNTYINVSAVDKHIRMVEFDSRLEIESKVNENFSNRFGDFIKELKEKVEDSYTCVIGIPDKDTIEKLKESLVNEEIVVLNPDRLKEKTPGVFIIPLDIKVGFEYPDEKFICHSEYEIFGKLRNRSKRQGKILNTRDFINYTDLNIGDLVVHENYGIGEYRGLTSLEVDNTRSDFIEIIYRNNDKLYIPTTEMALISKYVGNGDAQPNLSKLHTGEWNRTRAKAKKAIDEIAENLVELYAKRMKLKGHSFDPDTPWQKEFEDAFIYEETYSQLNAVKEIKEDMEKDQPMDRLLCGDVGYGKTEVAFRAAFKAVMGGKQAVMLAPTTILVKQHYKNMVERFKDFPVDVDYISRFKPAKQKEILKRKLARGQTDFVVGTHSLLSKGVKFKDIGLLIIDEEQRFGVKDKEKIKELAENVDVLTLSATPIPRTLQMSLSGIREMSLLEQPPNDRHPVNTYVMPYEPTIIRTAILKEMARQGQVYFVFNRVNGIETMKRHIEELVPEAKVAIAHGQMSATQIDKVLDSFVKNEIDVLLTTTIIETGMDIQNVNTIIVYNADRMGLSQLYQLKGRVGRSDRSSFAYFTYEKYKSINELAEKRLKAIKDFTEMGSGYKIAMRDLELRGAGNLLGESQSGHIESIGYDLYVKMLKEAVEEIKVGEVKKEKTESKIDIRIDAYIPDYYISDQTEKINMYKKISFIQDDKDLIEIQDELIDRFGDMPIPVENLVNLAYIRAELSKQGIIEMRQVAKEVEFLYNESYKLDMDKLQILSEKFKHYMRFNFAGDFKIILKHSKNILSETMGLLKILKEIKGDYYEKE